MNNTNLTGVNNSSVNVNLNNLKFYENSYF